MEHKLSHFLPSGTNNPFHSCQENGRCSLKRRLNKDTIQNKSYHYHTNNPFIHSTILATSNQQLFWACMRLRLSAVKYHQLRLSDLSECAIKTSLGEYQPNSRAK